MSPLFQMIHLVYYSESLGLLSQVFHGIPLHFDCYHRKHQALGIDHQSFPGMLSIPVQFYQFFFFEVSDLTLDNIDLDKEVLKQARKILQNIDKNELSENYSSVAYLSNENIKALISC